MKKRGFVYIVTNRPFGTLYIGVTSTLVQRTGQHKFKLIDGFSKKHHLSILVYYEVHETIEAAILREKQMKKWNRNWKLRQIIEMNPEWRDLYDEITQ
ncbi:MAG: GIY-YIG nuclease family protein [Rickettsiales bacterium]